MTEDAPADPDDLPELDAPPEGFEDEYVAEVTSHSFQELENLALEARQRGPMFYLIGGWAAWHYHQGLGSRDIDVIFPHRQILDRFLQTYYKKHDYKNVGGLLNKRYRRPVDVGDRTVRLQIDAAAIDQGPPFKEDEDRNIPYTELEDHHRTWELETAAVRVPTPELLILQKVKAWRDRRWELDHEAVAAEDVQRLQGKIWKDEYDIRNLAPEVGDWSQVWAITDRHDCTDLVEEAFRELGLDVPG